MSARMRSLGFLLILLWSGAAPAALSEKEEIILEKADGRGSRLGLRWDKALGNCEKLAPLDSGKWEKARPQLCKKVFGFYATHSSSLLRESESYPQGHSLMPVQTSEHLLRYRNKFFRVVLNKKETCLDADFKKCTKPTETMAEKWMHLLISEFFDKRTVRKARKSPF